MHRIQEVPPLKHRDVRTGSEVHPGLHTRHHPSAITLIFSHAGPTCSDLSTSARASLQLCSTEQPAGLAEALPLAPAARKTLSKYLSPKGPWISASWPRYSLQPHCTPADLKPSMTSCKKYLPSPRTSRKPDLCSAKPNVLPSPKSPPESHLCVRSRKHIKPSVTELSGLRSVVSPLSSGEVEAQWA